MVTCSLITGIVVYGVIIKVNTNIPRTEIVELQTQHRSNLGCRAVYMIQWYKTELPMRTIRTRTCSENPSLLVHYNYSIITKLFLIKIVSN